MAQSRSVSDLLPGSGVSKRKEPCCQGSRSRYSGKTGTALRVLIPDGPVRAIVHALAQVFARLEVRNVFAGKRHRFASLGIAALPRRTEVQRERAEAPYLDAISRRQGIAHDLEDLLERELHILGWQVFLFRRDDFDELGLCHRPLTRVAFVRSRVPINDRRSVP